MYDAAAIVIIPYPYSDTAQQKKRPVLMLTDLDPLGDFIGLAITSKSHHPSLIALTQDEMRSGALPKPSWVRTDKVFTLNASLISKQIGAVNNAWFQLVRQAVCGNIGCTHSA